MPIFSRRWEPICWRKMRTGAYYAIYSGKITKMKIAKRCFMYGNKEMSRNTLVTFGLGACTAIIAAFIPRNSEDKPVCHMWHHPVLNGISSDVCSKIDQRKLKYDIHVYIKKIMTDDHQHYSDVNSQFDCFIEKLKDQKVQVTVEEYSRMIQFYRTKYDYEHTLYC